MLSSGPSFRFASWGLDSDNGTGFINRALLEY
jgi:hypothetical protein